MKVKKVIGKLALNKKTIADLNMKKMSHINGGATPRCTFPDCTETCYTNPCNCGTNTCAGHMTCFKTCP